ncbi:hypothetical protein MesoLj131c_42210 [Mesorhizobium sp. 131-3-5]|uniref:hypothetical protein n=1 Tax=Mesorhizobium sp. 131-3-5 TaxID=2744520 RepID=UPI00192519DF|nr:hypothetical protein [Mesorhizobium sp. 131-3-5]BCH09963.1 hypothetical protein MesoLj131c_42210 [Mesorhizobium sp. 131-3-5]
MHWRWISGAIFAAFISGCTTDYLNNYDTVTLAAGDSNHANQLLQAVDPFNPNSQNTHIQSDGQRVAGVVQRFRGTTLVPPARNGIVVNVGNDGEHPCDLRTQVDSIGRSCGERSAEAKDGGRTGHEAGN